MWVFFLLLFLLLLYLFLIFPGRGTKASVFRGLYIAHRGLHSENITENTLAAFAAIKASVLSLMYSFLLTALRLYVMIPI